MEAALLLRTGLLSKNEEEDRTFWEFGGEESKLPEQGLWIWSPGRPPTAHMALGGASKAALASAPQVLRSAGFMYVRREMTKKRSFATGKVHSAPNTW